MDGIVFSIEEFSIYDGPGIRTSVFLKGCPLRCSWCHNPEGQKPQPEIVKSPNGCLRCGNCLRTSRTENGRTVLTEESIKNCPRNLIRMCGETYSAEALCAKLLKNAKILNHGGGVTFSGGEPLMQPDFLAECLTLLKGKVHTAVQTTGYCKEEVFERISGLADYFLYDLKVIDEAAHIRYTGVSNRLILKNFAALAGSGKAFVVRVPLIPGVTDTAENITRIARTMRQNGVAYAELLNYNKMAGGKYEMVGRTYEPDFDETQPSAPHEEIFREFGIQAKIIK